MTFKHLEILRKYNYKEILLPLITKIEEKEKNFIIVQTLNQNVMQITVNPLRKTERNYIFYSQAVTTHSIDAVKINSN